jgi:hypothetical protein
MGRKLPFPDFLLNTPATVTLNGQGLTEDGSPELGVSWSGKCIYSEKAKTVVDAERRLIRIEGSIIVKGDIAPALETLADGEVSVAGKQYRVYRSERPRNPDGTIHHTTLELM